MSKIIPALLAALLVLSACGSQGDSADGTEPSPTAGEDAAAREAAVAEVRAELPDEAPEKLVVMSVALAEILDGLGMEPVGVPASESPLPDSMADVEQVGSVISPDVEKITALQPDLVLGPASIRDSLEKALDGPDLPTAYVPTDSLDDLVATGLALGELYGSTEQAEALVAEVDRAQEEAVASRGDAEPTKVLLLFGATDELTVLNEDTYAGQIAETLGATNVAEEVGATEPYAPLSLEQVIVADPDVILFLAHGDSATAEKQMMSEVEDNDAWAKLTAVQEDRLRALDHQTFFSASLTGTPEAFDAMVTALQP